MTGIEQDEQRLTGEQVLAGYGRKLRVEEGGFVYDERATTNDHGSRLEDEASARRVQDVPAVGRAD